MKLTQRLTKLERIELERIDAKIAKMSDAEVFAEARAILAQFDEDSLSPADRALAAQARAVLEARDET